MRVALAGAAGFIGSHLCRRLLDDGHEVIGIDNFLTSSPDNIADLAGKHFTFIRHDVTIPLQLDGTVHAVANLASPASPVDYQNHPIETLKVGSAGTGNLLELAREKKARFLQASTSEIYGDPMVHPQAENYWGNVNPIGMRSMYDEAKRFGEALCAAYRRTHNLDVKIARIFNTYGPCMRLQDGRAIPNFVGQALRGNPLSVYGNGEQTRSFCFVDDLVEGLVRLLRSEFQGPMNLGNPKEFTIMELAQEVIALTGTSNQILHQPLPEDDPKQRRPDITLARKILSWEPKVELREGLKKTIAWMKEHLNKIA